MLRKTIFLCVTLLALHATAGADKNKDAPAEPAVEPKPEPLCIKDKRLVGVAQELADLQHIPPSPELIRTAREAGVDANPVYAKFGVTGEFDSFKAWLEDLKEKSDAPLICGRARSGERIVMVEAVDGGDFGSTIMVPVEWGRPLFVQLVATGPNGPRPVAERWVGKIPEGPTSRRGSQSPEAWLMQLRRATGARSVRSNRLLSQEATAHAQRVCDSGRLGHELDDNGDPEARLLKRGIHARVVGEAVARASTMREALHAIEDSPSHRMTVTDARFTDAGYGKAEDEKGRTCVVVLLASWPRKVP